MKVVDIVFESSKGYPTPPGFVEVESPPGTSIKLGEWVKRDDGYDVIRFEMHDPEHVAALRAALDDALARMDRARNLLTGGRPTPTCNWGMLDTSDIRGRLADG